MAKKIDIFGSAQEGGKGKGKGSDKITVYVDGLEQELLDFDFLKDKEKKNKTKLTQVDDVIRQTAKDEYIKLYRQEKKNPDSFYIKSGKGCIMVVPTDRYITIKEEDRVEYLRENYGKDIVTTEEKFIFNNEVLSRNMDVIKKLISSTKEISDSDKMNLLIRETTNTIKKGTIDRLLEYKDRMEIVLDDIQPVIQLKGCGDKAEDGGTAGENLGDEYESQIYKEEDEPKMVRTQFEEEEFEYAEGGSVEKIEWSDVRSDMQYPESDNNDGYIYGVNYLDDDGNVLDVEWFMTEEERENAISMFYRHGGEYESGGGVGIDEMRNEISEIVKSFSRKQYNNFAYEFDIDKNDADEMSNFIYALDEKGIKDVKKYLKDEEEYSDEYSSGGGVGYKMPNTVAEYRSKMNEFSNRLGTAESLWKFDNGKSYNSILKERDEYYQKTQDAWYEELSKAEASDNLARYNVLLKMINEAFKYGIGGAIEDNFDYGSDLTDESMVKKSLVNGEISCDTLSMILGCQPDYPVQVVGAIKLRKCYLRNSYKVD